MLVLLPGVALVEHFFTCAPSPFTCGTVARDEREIVPSTTREIVSLVNFTLLFNGQSSE